jgi:hypothetical protein
MQGVRGSMTAASNGTSRSLAWHVRTIEASGIYPRRRHVGWVRLGLRAGGEVFTRQKSQVRSLSRYQHKQPRHPLRDARCQQIVSNAPVRRLASHHRASSSALLQQGLCGVKQGGGGPCDVVRMAWHARGQGFKSPQLHRRSEAQSGLDRPRIARPRQQIGSNRRRAVRSVAHQSATPAVPTGVVSWSDPSPITRCFGRAGEVGLEAASTCSGDRGQEREGAATCDSVAPIVTACARPDPQILDAVRTQHGTAPS